MERSLFTAAGVIGADLILVYYLLDTNLNAVQKAVVFWAVIMAYAWFNLSRPTAYAVADAYAVPALPYPEVAGAPAAAIAQPYPSYQPYPATPPAPQPATPAAPLSGYQAAEKAAIERIIHRSTLPFYVESVTDTPDYTYYNLERIPDFPTYVQWSEINNITKEIATEIYRTRSSAGGVTAVFNEQPPYIRVTAPVRRVLPWSARGNGKSNAPMFTALLGMFWVHGRAALTSINLTDQKECHVGVFSSSGGGKSVLLHIMALSLIENADPGQVELYFIDLDSDQFDIYKSLPHVRMVAGTDAEALALLQYLVDGMDRQVSTAKRRILIVDELQMLTVDSDNADDFIDLIGQLGQRWRKRGGNLILATQDPSGKNFPKAVQRNIKVTVAGFTEDDEYLSRYLNVPGASKLRGDGDFLIRKNGQVTNIKSFWLKEEDKLATIAAIKARWGEDTRNNLRLDLPEDEADTAAPANAKHRAGYDSQPAYEEDADDYADDEDTDDYADAPLFAKTAKGIPTSVNRRPKGNMNPIPSHSSQPAKSTNVLPKPVIGKDKKLHPLALRLLPILDEVWDAENEQWIDRTAAFNAIFGEGAWHSNTHYTKKAKEVVLYALTLNT